jgi:hypothetical protein
MMHPADRARATERVLQGYRDSPFSWADANCIRLAREQALAMGHDVPEVPAFRTAKGAQKALLAMGASTVAELLDMYFERWPAPAFARLGDICTLDGEHGEGLEAVCVFDGQGNLFGWHDDKPEGLAAIKYAMANIKGAWKL